MRKIVPTLLAVAALGFAAASSLAGELKLGANDTMQSILASHKGGKVTLRVQSGQDITGIVREVNSEIVQIGAVSGKEFYDAMVSLDSIEAVYLRIKD
jgi:hypothetical protein